MKTISVFGASGKTGLCVVKQALANSYKINALCRNPDAIPFKNTSLKIFTGSLLDKIVVHKTIEGSDAVICVFGPMKPYNDIFCAEATENIITAMLSLGIRRLICQTGALIGKTPVRRSLFMRFLMKTYNGKFPESARDRDMQEELIMKSSMDWTIVKPPRLSNGKRKGKYSTGENLKVSAFSSATREDAADFILSQLESDNYLKKLPIIKN